MFVSLFSMVSSYSFDLRFFEKLPVAFKLFFPVIAVGFIAGKKRMKNNKRLLQ
jgi:hypothetical protein